jgi:hypothetical protein
MGGYSVGIDCQKKGLFLAFSGLFLQTKGGVEEQKVGLALDPNPLTGASGFVCHLIAWFTGISLVARIIDDRKNFRVSKI